MTDQALPLEPGHEVDLTCGLAENPCPPSADEDDSAGPEAPEVNDYSDEEDS